MNVLYAWDEPAFLRENMKAVTLEIPAEHLARLNGIGSAEGVA